MLLPPVCYPVVCERALSAATYARKKNGEGLEMKMDEVVEGNEAGIVDGKVPFATWDPDCESRLGEYEGSISPMRVMLNPGDMLYLPTQW